MNGFLSDQIARLMPIPVIAFLVLFFGAYWIAQMPAKGTAEWVDFTRSKGKVYDFERRCMGGRDWIAMAVVTLIYAAVTFFYLGVTDNPVSFYRFEHNDQPLVVTLDEPVEVSRLQYYAGLNLDNHRGKTLKLEATADGEKWVKLADISRNYAQTFRWQEVADEFTKFGQPVKALRFYTDGSGLDLGEIALRDADDNLIDASHVTVTREEGAAGAGETAKRSKDEGRSTLDPQAVLDEQGVVPVRRTILNGTHFDEIYHAYTAYEFLEGWYPYENTHPPLGKLTTALGIKLFGMTPFGWRFMPALFGVLMLPFLFVLIQNMFGKTLISVCGTTIFAFDFMHFTQTRISTIDVYAVFYIIVMFLFMYRWMVQEEETRFSRTVPDLALCGLAFGLGAASKWTCIYAGLGLVALYVWGLIRRYRACRRNDTPFWGFFWKTIAASVLFFAIIPAGIYIASYTPYVTDGSATPAKVWEACWANQKTMLSYHGKLSQKEIKAPEDGAVIDILFQKGESIKRGETYLVFAGEDGYPQNLAAEEDCRILRVKRGVGKTVGEGETMVILTTAGHPYASKWYQWLLDIRPVYFFAGDYYDENNETVVFSPTDGVVTEVAVTADEGFEAGRTLMTVETLDGRLVEVKGKANAKVTEISAELGAHVSRGDALMTTIPYLRSSASTFNNPIVAWGGLLALIAALVMLIFRGRRVALFILIGYAAQLVPWIPIERTTYEYHYFPATVFCVLAICFVFDTYLERVPARLPIIQGVTEEAPRLRPPPYVMILAFTALTVVLFAMFYPVLAGYPVPSGYVKYFLRWLASWPV